MMNQKHRTRAFFLCFGFLSLSTAQTQMTPPPSPPSNLYMPDRPRFNSSLAIIWTASVLTFFLMAFFALYIKLCTERREPGMNWDPSLNLRMPSRRLTRGRESRLTRGLEASVIDSFPTFAYSRVKGLKTGKGTLECAICLNAFKDDETLRLIPKCSHVFHSDCIDVWLSSHSTCPVCHADLAPNSGKTISCATVQVNGSEPENRPENNNTSDGTSEIAISVESPDVNMINSNVNMTS